MANDAIVRLKLDSGEYEGKIKRATQGLLQMEKECRSLGGIMVNMDKEQLNFVQGLGKMETKSQSVNGKIRELTSAYNELRAQYNRLSEEEKKGDYGKALNKSLGELRDRIRDGKKELEGFGKELSNNGSILDGLSSKFGVSTKQLVSWGAAIGAGKAALDLYKTALENNEAMVDAWGQTVSAAEGLYRGFANALSTADFGGFFANMGRIVDAATAAYRALDELQTKGGIISNSEKKLNARRAQYQKTLRDPNASAEEKNAARLGLERIAVERKGAAAETQLLNNNVIRANIRQKMVESGMSEADIKKYYPMVVRSLYSTSAADALDKVNLTYNRKGGAMLDEYGKPIAGTSTYSVNLGNIFTDKFRNEQLNPYVQAYWDAEGRMYMDERADNRILGAGGKGGGRSGGRGGGAAYVPKTSALNVGAMSGFGVGWAELFPEEVARKQAEDWWKKWSKEALEVMEQSPLQGGIQMLDTSDMGGFSFGTTKPKDGSFEAMFNPEGLDGIQGKMTSIGNATQFAADAVNQMGNAFASLGEKSVALNVLGTVAQAVATVALSYAQAMKMAAETTGPWGWIAFAATGMATMISTIAAIKGATAGSFANGGVVGGNNYNDGLSANVSSGEVIFNRTDAGKLYDYVHNNSVLGGGRNALKLETSLHGSTIRIALNNEGRERGVGKVI